MVENTLKLYTNIKINPVVFVFSCCCIYNFMLCEWCLPTASEIRSFNKHVWAVQWIQISICSSHRSYIPEVRIMSIPNLRYMKVCVCTTSRCLNRCHFFWSLPIINLQLWDQSLQKNHFHQRAERVRWRIGGCYFLIPIFLKPYLAPDKSGSF